ncbi:MAG: GNAT family N-acetyltransferase [Eubacteriales bacterium]
MISELEEINIRSYQSDDLDWVIDRHSELYRAEHGFDDTFRAYVADPVRQFGESMNPEKENLWISESQGRRIGMIAIVRVSETTAQLRWFLLEPEMRGFGIGNMLIKTAVDFCIIAGYRHVFLWTVSSMAAARRLYQSYNFKITESAEHSLWGQVQIEERWDLDFDVG